MHPSIRKALRVAIVMPSLYAVMLYVADDPFAALFGAFGCFALLVFADFGGSTRERLVAYVIATLVGAALVSLGTAVSQEFALAAVLMVIVGFTIRFLGVFGGAWAAGASAVTLSYVLAATVPAPVADIQPRVIGWVLGGIVATVSALVLWPVYERDELRDRIAEAVRAAAQLVRAYWDEDGDPSAARSVALAAVDTMRTTLDTATLRPSGPAVRDRALIALVEGAERLVTLVTEDATEETIAAARDLGDCLRLCEVTAGVLDAAADVLVGTGRPPDFVGLETARAEQLAALADWTAAHLEAGDDAESVVADLEGIFWTRITSYLALGIAADATIARGGSAAVSNVISALHTPVVAFGSLRERITYLLRAHSLVRSARFADAARAGIGLGLAVFVAGLTGVDHGFWVVLGTLSVLRSNALATGRTAFEAIGGTLLGFCVITPGVILFGGDTTVLWVFLPITVFLAAYAPTAISFLIGQASFTAFVVVLFNILEPEGITTGVARVQDIAIGAAVSTVVGVLLWPRGARGMLRGALADQCRTDADFLARAMSNIVGGRADTGAARTRAVEAGLRAVEAFDQLGTEPGMRPEQVQHIADVAVSARRVRGVAELMVGQADLGFVVERSDVRDALQHECTVLCDVLRADGGAIAAGNDPPKLQADPPVAVRDVAVEAVVAWGGKGPGAAALGALWAWEWMRLVHVALVRAKPGVASLAESADTPWWR